MKKEFLKNYDLTKRSERYKAVGELGRGFCKEFKATFEKSSPDLFCQVSDSQIEIGVKEESKDKHDWFLFTSSITFYGPTFFNEDRFDLNFGSTGSCTPDDKASYWRTIHASEVLQKWEKAKELCEKYWELRKTLVEAIEKTTNNLYQ